MAASENTQTGNFEISSQRLLILTTINKLNTQRLQMVLLPYYERVIKLVKLLQNNVITQNAVTRT